MADTQIFKAISAVEGRHCEPEDDTLQLGSSDADSPRLSGQ